MAHWALGEVWRVWVCCEKEMDLAIILGLDPGSQRAGYGVIDFQPNQLRHLDSGTIKIDIRLSWEQRLEFIYNSLDPILSKYSPDQIIIEKVFLGKNADSAFKLGQVRGVLLLLASQHKTSVFEYAAKKIKKVVTGHGGATKEHVQLIVSRLLGLAKFSSFDQSDALAIALCHCFASQTQLKVMDQGGVQL